MIADNMDDDEDDTAYLDLLGHASWEDLRALIADSLREENDNVDPSA